VAIDMSAAVKSPARKSTGTTSRTPAKATQQDTRTLVDKRTEGLNGVAQLIQGGLLLFGQHADAAAIGMHFPAVSKELAACAESNEAIAKPIDFLIEVGPYGALIAAALPLVMQFAANHKLVNASMLAGQGVVPPEVLESQMKAQMAQMQAQALREQREAVRLAQQAQKEYDEMLLEEMQAGRAA
jgi:hypothetical protein